MIDSVIQDVRHTIRQLGRAPMLAVAVIATLAVAIGASAALLSLLNAVVLRPLPVQEPGRLVLVSLSDRRGQTARLIPHTTFRELAAHQQVFEDLAMYSGGGVFPLEARGRLVEGNIATVTPTMFPMLGARAHLGRLIAPEDAPGTGEPARVVVLGYRM